jgi:predicted ATPase
MLKRIYIHNYRSFVNFEWQPPPICVLVGPNGAGKSALLEILCLLQDLVVHGKRLDEVGFPSTLTVWRKDEEQTVEIDIELAGERFSYRLRCRKENGSSSIAEQLSSDGSLLYRSGEGEVEIFGDPPASASRAKIPFSSRTSFLASLESRPDNQRITKFKDYIQHLWYLKPDPVRLGGAAASEAPWLERDLTNFASWYRTRVQEEPDAIAALRQDLQRALPGFDQLRLQPMSGGTKDLLVRFRYGNNSHELSWDKLSDGQRMLIALYGTYRLAVPTATLIALDEIENFVAPSEIQPWLREVVDTIAANNSQLIAISHHSESINYLAADSMWRMWRDSQGGHTRIALLEINRDSGEAAYEATKAEAANA